MNTPELIYRDKLSLELFREGKRPIDTVSDAEGLLFINTKPNGNTKLAVRPITGNFSVSELTHQNKSASVNERTKYLLFCDNVHVDIPEPIWDPTITTTNRAIVNGNFLLEKDGVLSLREHSVNSLLNTIEADPNLIVLYDHSPITGVNQQTLVFVESILGATNSYYLELDGMHINSRGESIIDALLNYEETSRLYISASNDVAKETLATEYNVKIHNRDSKPHRLYIRYSGADTEVRKRAAPLTPAIYTSDDNGYVVDPDGLGIEITFAALDTAHPVILPWFQYSIGGNAIVGNRYVIEVNGIKYRDNRTVNNISSPTASLSGVVETNSDLAELLSVDSNGEYNKFVNLTANYMDVKIYLDEVNPYHQNNKTVDTGNNPAGIYKKLRYPYGSKLCNGNLRKTYTNSESVKVNVTDAGLSFRLGPHNVRG